MPIPTPSSDEDQDDFISRCMSNETMVEDFPDNDQRLAVCFETWRDREKALVKRTNETDREFMTRCMCDKELERKYPERKLRLEICINLIKD